MNNKISENEIWITKVDKKYIKLFDSFSTLEQDLIDFLKEDSIYNQEIKLSITYLFLDDKKQNILGYVSILSDSIKINADLGKIFVDKGINYKSLPAIKIGRLCVNSNFERRGIGTLLIDFVHRICINLSMNYLGCRLISLDSKRESIKFYEKVGFKILRGENKLQVPMYLDIEKYKVREK
ncbi:MAG: GNAT family N-acetyltransferase [Nanoarchaeales archaeon]|nr:GNAT family N-acetyltransferase [Nanoarchaeales archaeon]